MPKDKVLPPTVNISQVIIPFFGMFPIFDGDNTILLPPNPMSYLGSGNEGVNASRSKKANIQIQDHGDPIVTNFNLFDPSNGQLVASFSGIEQDQASFFANVFPTNLVTALLHPDQAYTYEVSLLDGDCNVIVAPGMVGSGLEVGSGGTATVVGGSADTLWLWHTKDVIWTNNGTGNTLELTPETGQTPQASEALVLNLQTGIGVNPYGGTLDLQNVDIVQGGETNGFFVIANNNGDTISALFGGNTTIIGGSGNDHLTGSLNGTSVIIAGSGTATLSAGFADDPTDSPTIFTYQLGVDEITNFTAGNGSGNWIDLTGVPGITSFAQAMADASEINGNTVFDFGGGRTLTLDGVASSDLTASNFLFQPIIAYTSVAPGAAGQTFQLTLHMSDPITVNTSGGTPQLMLSNGATATYDAAASDPAHATLVFDYSGAWPLNLAIASLDPDGAIISGAGGEGIDLSDSTTALPPVVQSVSASLAGEADTGQTVHLTLQMSDALAHVGVSQLSLNDGGTASYDPGLSQLSAGKLVFDYTVRAGDHTPNLEVTGIALQGGSTTNAAGEGADFSGAFDVETGLRIGSALYASVTTSDGPGEADAGAVVQFALNMNEAVTVNTSGGPPTLTLSDGATATYDAAASDSSAGTLVFDYLVGTNDHSPDLKITSVNAVITDASNDTPSYADVVNASTGLQIGVSPLTVTSVSASPSGDVGLNQTITLTLTMSEAFTVAGNPILALNDGDIALYAGSSGNQINFVTTVQPGDDTANLAITAVGYGRPDGSVQDSSGYKADFSNAIGAATGVQVQDPLDVVSVKTDPATGEVLSGQTVKVTLNMSEGFTIDTTGGSPSLMLSDGEIATYDAASSNPGSGALVFDYAVGANDRATVLDVANVLLNGATISDAGGNPANFADAVGALTALQVGPTGVTNVSTSKIGDIQTGQTIQIVLTTSQNMVVDTSGGSPTLTLSDGAIATFNATETANYLADPGSVGALVFDYTVGANDHAADLEINAFNPHDATFTDLDGFAVDFSTAYDHFSGVSVNEVACYCRGTLIATDRGQKRVEDLEIGNFVKTETGMAHPIKWIGRRSYGGHFVQGRKDILPICIKAGALEENVPRRDLWISPHHAMYLGGVLIEGKDLVNGVSVVQAEEVDRVEYFHIELDSHDVILAEGAPSETFVDDDSRAMFHNAQEYVARFPGEERRPARYCAPRLVSGDEVEMIRQRLAQRAGIVVGPAAGNGALRGFVDSVSECTTIEGWAQNAEYPEAPVCLDIFADDRLIGQTLANLYREDLKAAGLGSGRHAFKFSLMGGKVLHPGKVQVRRSSDGALLAAAAIVDAA